jgi:hypothetical protein
MARYNPNDFPENRDPNKPKGGGGGNYIPVGKHIVKVIDHTLTETSGGHGQMEVNFEDRQGRTRKGWFIYEGAAGFQLARLLSAFNWSDPLDLDRPGDVRRAIYGKDVEIVVADEAYQGKVSTKVKYVNAIRSGSGGGGGRVYDKHENRNEAPAGDGAPPPSDDDIPF